MRIIRASRRRPKHQRQRYQDSQSYQNSLPQCTFTAPAIFSLEESPEELITFINSSDAQLQLAKYSRRVYFDLSLITKVDNGAIGLLLTFMNMLSKLNVRFQGNSPIENDCAKIFLNSGFFDYVQMLQGKKIEHKDKYIVQKGANKTDNAMVGREIRKITKHLLGISKPFPPLYSLIGEIISNSIEHANKSTRNKNWLLSIHYEEDKVCFMATDMGRGILDTLRKKFRQKLFDDLTFTSDLDTLKNLFDKKYQSSTFEANRNKGLPRIKECFDNNFISNLIVITNNVILDFTGERSRNLIPAYQGTVYSWEVTKDNLLKWQARSKT